MLFSVCDFSVCFLVCGDGLCVCCEVYVVDGVSFDFFFGEMLGIVGESGCGKLMMVKVLMNMVLFSGSV